MGRELTGSCVLELITYAAYSRTATKSSLSSPRYFRSTLLSLSPPKTRSVYTSKNAIGRLRIRASSAELPGTTVIRGGGVMGVFLIQFIFDAIEILKPSGIA